MKHKMNTLFGKRAKATCGASDKDILQTVTADHLDVIQTLFILNSSLIIFYNKT